MNEPIAIGEMSGQIMPVHCHLTMARALKGNDIPIFGSLPSRVQKFLGGLSCVPGNA